MSDDTATFQVDVSVLIQLPTGSPDELASQAVAAALATDQRIYKVDDHTPRLLLQQ